MEVLPAISFNTTNSSKARPRQRDHDRKRDCFPTYRGTNTIGASGRLAPTRVRHFRRPEERPFTAEERQRVTILFGGLTWKHEKFIQAVFHGSGYRCEILPNPNLTAYHLGRKFGNPAQCNPTYFTVGSLIQYLRELEERGLNKQEILNNYVFFTVWRMWTVPLRNV